MKKLALKSKIETEFIGGHYDGDEKTEKILSKIVGKPVKCYDTKIDDGVDDDECEDEYIMKSCFSTEDDKIIVGIYYGDVTDEIGYVNVQIN
jgi:hypothetical protein